MGGSHEGVVVIHLKPRSRLRPSDAPRLAGLLREAGVKPVIVRVAPGRVEVEVPSHKASDAMREASRLIGDPIEVSGPHGDPSSWLEEFRRLAANQRFWEAHTAAEAGWRIAGEKWAKALAAAAGALAKAQEGLIRAALKASETAAREAEAHGVGLDPECLRREVERAYTGLEARLEQCIRLDHHKRGEPGGESAG